MIMKEIILKKPTTITFNNEKLRVKPLVIRTKIKAQNHGGARITVSQDYAKYEALIFILEGTKK
ncbi:hypothetical protein HYU11_03035 [Candidatus Woesearchaeota archaeon]|nr:hypothetical protein [Candidatus Woesearchaeota archaeon]